MSDQLTGTIKRKIWSAPDSDYVVYVLESEERVVGNQDPDDRFETGVKYKFIGKIGEHPEYGPQMQFAAYTRCVPMDRYGVVEYMRKHAPGVGEAIANRIVDHYGADRALQTIKSQPELVAQDVSGISLESCHLISEKLKEIEKNEEVQVQLMGLFKKLGFRQSVIAAAIKKWGIAAPEKIKRNPFCLLQAQIPGCGFLTVDKLYKDLGYDPSKIRRQVFCVDYYLRSEEPTGSTWTEARAVAGFLEKMIDSGAPKPKKALRLGIRSGMFAKRVENGTVYVALTARANQEKQVMERLVALS